jgi:hypothetical protein
MIDLGRVSTETKSIEVAPAFEQPFNGLKYVP